MHAIGHGRWFRLCGRVGRRSHQALPLGRDQGIGLSPDAERRDHDGESGDEASERGIGDGVLGKQAKQEHGREDESGRQQCHEPQGRF
jgi:hypothetical protein